MATGAAEQTLPMEEPAIVSAVSADRREDQPCFSDEQTKDRVAEYEHSARGIVIQQLLNPMLDEAATVGFRRGFGTQPIFQRREGAGDVQPGFRDDDHDSAQMREPQSDAIYQSPPPEVADDDEHKAANDERDKREVQRKHGIREHLIRQDVAH